MISPAEALDGDVRRPAGHPVTKQGQPPVLTSLQTFPLPGGWAVSCLPEFSTLVGSAMGDPPPAWPRHLAAPRSRKGAVEGLALSAGYRPDRRRCLRDL